MSSINSRSPPFIISGQSESSNKAFGTVNGRRGEGQSSSSLSSVELAPEQAEKVSSRSCDLDTMISANRSNTGGDTGRELDEVEAAIGAKLCASDLLRSRGKAVSYTRSGVRKKSGAADDGRGGEGGGVLMGVKLLLRVFSARSIIGGEKCEK